MMHVAWCGGSLTCVDFEPDHEVGDDAVKAGLHDEVGYLNNYLPSRPRQLSIIPGSPLPAWKAGFPVIAKQVRQCLVYM